MSANCRLAFDLPSIFHVVMLEIISCLNEFLLFFLQDEAAVIINLFNITLV